LSQSAGGTLDLIATATFGLEAVVSRELKQLGYADQKVEDGHVLFRGDETAICRANLRLRSADRVLVRVGSFEARDFGKLFDATMALPWADWLPFNAAFPVRGRSVKSQLHSVPDCQAIVKKAIVEKLRKTTRTTWFPEDGPEYSVEVALLKDRATLTIDTTGPGLHKRGYRKRVGPAPLKETLAAGLVQLSYWNRERPLIDPFCGTGTIAIEAALIGRNLAPGLHRTFAAEHWPRIPKSLWDEARSEARALAGNPLPEPVIASDVDAESLRQARHNAETAGVANDIRFEQSDARQLATHRKYGCIITNPPYGERLGEDAEVEKLHADFARAVGKLDTWSIYVLTAVRDFERMMNRKADRKRKLYNGRIECAYYQFQGPRPPWVQPPERTE
jgi:putative N6-adenine-specific DNA methylase